MNKHLQNALKIPLATGTVLVALLPSAWAQTTTTTVTIPTPKLLGNTRTSTSTSVEANLLNDRGTVYIHDVPILLQLTFAAGNVLPSATSVVVTITNLDAPNATPITLVGGQDFDIPTTANTTTTATTVTIVVPRSGTVRLGDGRYKIVVTVTQPATTTPTAQAAVTLTDTQFIRVTSRVQSGGRAMFSTPFKPVAGATTAETALFNGSSYRLARWKGIDGGYAYFSSSGQADALASFSIPNLPDGRLASYDATQPSVSLSPLGLGYWLDIAGNTTLNLTGTTTNNPVAVSLPGPTGGNPQGWYMIGDPYTYAVEFGALSVQVGTQIYSIVDAANNNIIRNVLIGYANGDYVYTIAPGGQLVPFNGYWVQALQPCTLIIPPVATVTFDPTRAQRGRALVADGWQVRLMAETGGDRDGQNYLGQRTGGTDAQGKLDINKPPSGAGHAYLRFTKNDTKGRAVAFATDMRPVSGSGKQDWTASVTTDRSNADVTVAWEGVGNVPRRNRLMLVDTATGAKVAMKSRSSYTYKAGEAGSTRVFKVTMEPETSGGVLAIVNATVTHTRGVGGMSVQFSTNRDAEVSGVLKTTGGKRVATLTGASRAVGASATTLHWGGRSDSGTPLPVGPYVLEVTARTEDGQTAVLNRVIMQLR